MQKTFLLLSVILLAFWVGKVVNEAGGEEVTDVAGRPLTIFGRLSQVVQLGSTEETIGFKLQTESYLVTIEGEVLLNRPAYLTFDITDLETGERVDNLDILVEMCQAIDEEIYGAASCDEAFADGSYHYQIAAQQEGTLYRADGFEWDRDGLWALRLTLTDAATGQVELLEEQAEIYPQRPPSSNLFELSNISLPFVVIGLFWAVVWWRNGRFVQPIVESNAA